VVTTEYIVI